MAEPESANADVDKAQEIRRAAETLTARGEKPQAATIIGMLKSKSIKVSVPQVQLVLDRMERLSQKVAAISTMSPDGGAYKSFDDWWSAVAEKQVARIEQEWLKDNEPNDPEEEDGGDHWNANQMMHDGEAHEMTAELAEEVWNKGVAGEEWEMSMEYSLFCDLDDVIAAAYHAGKALRS